MSPTAIRFRCRRCERLNSVAPSKAGKLFVCPSCFAPLVVPELAVAAGPSIPTAEAISVLSSIDPPIEPIADEPVASVDARGQDRDASPAPCQRPSGAPDVPLEVEPDVETSAILPDEQLVPEPVAREWLAGVGWGVVIAAIGLIAALGAIAGLSRSQSGRRADDPIARSDPTTRASSPVVPAQPPGVPIMPAPAAMKPNPAPLRPPAPVAEALVRPPAPVALAPSPPAEPARPIVVQRRRTIPAPLSPPAPVAKAPPPPAEPARPRMVRRRQLLDQEALRKQLDTLPELALDDRTLVSLLVQHGMTFATPLSTGYRRTARGGVEPLPDPRPRDPRSSDPRARLITVATPLPHGSHDIFALIRQLQPELTYLPWRLGEDCHLPREPAENLQGLSRALRDLLQQTTPSGDARPDPELLRPLLLTERTEPPTRPRSSQRQEHWVEPAAIPALLQLLMAERSSTRQVLVDVLAKIPGKEAVVALARRALYDLAPEVRDRAIEALRSRSAEDYRALLLDGLRYPWPPAADHAAEALVALGDREAVPTLIGLLDKPDPQTPTTVVRYGRPTPVVRTLVRVNHLKNCLLCHAPSTSPTGDLVRGRVPSPGEPLPPPRQYYGASETGLFVRAEVTYIRQDFSVTQPVDGADPWPGQQRFDYLVAERPTSIRNPSSRTKKTSQRAEKPVPGYPQRESVLFALRELTGKDAGTDSQDWKAATVEAAGPAAAKDSTDE